MPRFTFAALAAALPLALAQQIGSVPEVHPGLTTQQCTVDACITQQTSVVLDSTIHAIQTENGTSCLLNNGGLNPAICPTQEKCAKNCYIEGANYDQNGVDTSGSSVGRNSILLTNFALTRMSDDSAHVQERERRN